ncbi:MAG: hypothetical protein P8P74_01710 [Crocinitomicaceae bacterium]|nr:hypothetical protein [Crocinitomicaceae bacterium]
MRFIKHILNVLSLVLVAFSSWAQLSESEIRKNADKLFEAEEYVQATPLYLQLLNLYPTDAELNFKYGTCSLFNDDKQKKDAIKFLNAATKTATVDPRAFYFKGKALHLNYQFDEAKKFYKIYQSKRATRDDRYDVDREIEMCQNGKKLMIQFTDIIVSEKTQIEDDKFFRLYKDMQSIGGDILVTERFQSKLDKKRGHVPIVHYPKDAKAVYYSSYGNNGKTGLDIYVRKRLPDGSWGEPYRLPGEINTEYDEDFPYLHPNGRYLYFSSKGHNSMGGFDVFLARMNPDNGQFQGIENVDFAICSPDDDLFYIVDADYKNAYFASSRQSEDGKLHVYRVKVVRIPVQEIIVMGDFVSEINPDNKKVSIDIASTSTGSDVGKIVSNKAGKYSFVFPKGGKYDLTVNIEGLEPLSKTIDLPFLDEFRPLKQKIVHYMDNGQEKVKIIDLFDESVDGGEELIAQVLREKSNLEVNIDQFDDNELRRIELEARRADILAQLGFDGMKVREVQNQLSELAEADTKKAEDVQKLNAGISEAYIGLSEEIEELTTQRDALIAQAENETDPAVQYKTLLEAQRIDIEREKLLDQANGLTELKDEVQRKLGNDDPENSEISKVEEEFNRLIEAGQEEEALSYLAQQKDEIDNSKNVSTQRMVDELIQKTIDQRARQDVLVDRNQTNRREIELAETRKIELESKLPNAKRKEAARIREELAELDNTIELYKDEENYNQDQIVEINKDIDVLDAQVSVLQSSGESVLKEIDQRKYDDAQAAIKAQQAKDRAEELENDIAQIESTNPDIIGIDPSNTSTSIADELIDEHTAFVNQIESNGDDRQTQLESIISQNEQTINSIDQRLRNVEEELIDTPGDEKLIAEQTKLNEFKVELELKQSDLTAELQELRPDVTQTFTKESVLEELAPDYAATKEAIESDLSLTEVERLKQLQANDLELKTSGEQKLNEIQNALQNDPTNNTLLQELQVVNDVLFDTNKSIEDRAERIDQIENGTPDVAITKQDVIASVSAEYLNESKAIQSDPQLGEQERLEALNELDQSMKSSVEERLTQVNNSLGTSPNDSDLLGEQQILEEIISDLVSGINTRESQIADLNSTQTQPFNSTEAIAAVQPNYETEIGAIDANDNLSEVERLEQKQNLDYQLVDNLQNELEEVQNELANDPTNEQLKIQEEGLTEVINSTQNRIDAQAQTLSDLNSATASVDVESTKQAVLDEVKVDYENRLAEINESSAPEVERNLDRLELEQEILTSLTEREEETRSELESDPENPQLNAEVEAITQLIAEQTQAVEEQRQASLEAAKSAEIYEQTIADADRKYNIEIGELMREENPSSEKIVERELELQENLEAELAKNLKSLDRKYSVDVDLESMILANEIAESKQRQAAAENATNVANNTAAEEQEFVKELRESFISVGDLSMQNDNPTLEEARSHESTLEDYLVELKTKKADLQSQLDASPDDREIQHQISWIESEEEAVEQELRQMSITIGELESGNVVAENTIENDPELRELETKQSDIETQLKDPNLSNSERKALDEELDDLKDATLKRTNDIQSEQVVAAQEKQDNINSALKQLGDGDPETTEVKSAITASEEERQAIENMLEKSDNAKTQEERNYWLNEAEIRQDKLNSRLEQVVENREIQNIEEQEDITILSREELEKRKRGFLIEIGELEVQQGRVEDEIETAKRKELPELNEEKEAITAQLDLLKNQLEHIEARIENFDVTEPVDRMATVGLDQEITFSEEREIAASDAFKTYREEGVKALEIENDLRNFQLELDLERKELVDLLATPKSAERDEQIELKTSRIKELESTIQDLNVKFDEQMAVADRLLPDDEEEAMKIQNLLVRGVQPIKTAVIATAIVNMPNTGFAIDENAESVYTEANPIPVGVKNPSGLTYRVQIGAFARPIPQDLFKEFNPVSGEKIANTNITRYMAGFFNSSESVVEARQSIRALGYRDAFVVAYCDGERITFGQARRLEASGQCVPKGTDELVLEVAENTADHMGIPTVTKVIELPEYSYNQAPGAAEADPIELKQGLFFTVQIGVYNRPVDDATIKNLPEILTVRLPNGLIRYATGMFDSPEEASPRRREAVNKGIRDAFIVAYYKGERMTVARARILLDREGPSILQSNIEKTTPVEVVEVPDNVQRTDSVTTEVVETTIATEEPEQKVQIVTQKTFEDYPRDVLNRYNTEGNFYFDESDGKVKSEIYSSKRELPRLYKFENDIDTVYLSEAEVQSELDKRHILVKLADDKVPGDLADWLLRMGYQKKFIRVNGELELHIQGIEPNAIQDVQYRIREVGLEPVFVELTEED